MIRPLRHLYKPASESHMGMALAVAAVAMALMLWGNHLAVEYYRLSTCGHSIAVFRPFWRLISNDLTDYRSSFCTGGMNEGGARNAPPFL